MRALSEITAYTRLIEAWRTIYRESSDHDRAELNKTLGDALAGVGDEWGRGWHKDTERALELFMALGWSTGQPGGIALERWPAWLDEPLLRAMVDEAEACRATGMWGVANFSSDDCVLPTRLLASRPFIEWVCRLAGRSVHHLDRKVSLAYIYYLENERCPLHVDDPRTHALQLLVCLEHTRPPAPHPASVLRIHAPGRIECYDFEPGDAILFRGDRMPHARTPLGPGERITLLSIGFKFTVDDFEQPRGATGDTPGGEVVA
jgi:hypothetical protein